MDAPPPVGTAVPVSPLIRRVLAPNPGIFTHTGTGTFIVGAGRDVAVIDPGPDSFLHLDSILAAVGEAAVSAILVTHTHRDHSPLAAGLALATGAPVLGCAPLALAEDSDHAEEGFDTAYAPERVLADGDTVSGDGWTLAAVHTPGHTSNHLCYALAEEKALFSGDHVMGWSTTVIIPPDGSMGAYMASLAKLQARDDAVLYPTHGVPIDRPQSHLRGLVLHRRQREAQVLGALADGPARIAEMVPRLYANIDRRLWPAAGMSVKAHLIDLAERGRVHADGDRWVLA